MQMHELWKMALQPPADIEASDWKDLAKTMALRAVKSYWHYQHAKVTEEDYSSVRVFEVYIDDDGLWARTENPVQLCAEDSSDMDGFLAKLIYDKDRYGVISLEELDAQIGTHPGHGSDDLEEAADDSY